MGTSSGSIYVFSTHPDGSPNISKMVNLARRVLSSERWDFDVNVIIVDDLEIKRLNRLFLGLDEETDVIAFPSENDEGSGGEIYLSLDQARSQALENSEPVQKALERLLVHGILHLGGWDDAADEQRSRMIEYGEQYLIEKTFTDI